MKNKDIDIRDVMAADLYEYRARGFADRFINSMGVRYLKHAAHSHIKHNRILKRLKKEAAV